MIYTVTLNPALDYFMNYEELALGEVNRTGKTQVSAGGKGFGFHRNRRFDKN